MTALKEYVKAGLGVAVVPDIIVGESPPKGTLKKKVQDLEVGVVTGVLQKNNNVTTGAAINRLINLIKESFIA
jgi:DNA-binding transcriptional LysR family regulator